MNDDHSSILTRPLRKSHLGVLLLVLLAVLVSFASFRLGVKKEARSAAFREYHAKVRACHALGRIVNQTIKVAWRKHVSKEEFVEYIGPVEPVDESKHPEAGADDTHVYFHPESRRLFYLRFTEEGLMGHSSRYGPADIKIPLPAILQKEMRMYNEPDRGDVQ